MSIEAIDWVRDLAFEGINPHHKCFLFTLATYASPNGECWPSKETLIEKTRIKDRHMRLIRQTLETWGLLRTRIRAGKVVGYFLNLRWQPDLLERYLPIYSQKRERRNPDSALRRERWNPDSENRNPDSSKRTVKNRQESKRGSERVHEPKISPPDHRRSAPPPPPASDLPQVVRKGPAVEQGPDRVSRGRVPLDMVGAWNRAVARTRMPQIERRLTDAEWKALERAMKHPRLGDLDAWQRFCRWAAADPFLAGDRQGGYPASLMQVAQVQWIDRWAGATKPKPPERPFVRLPPDTPIRGIPIAARIPDPPAGPSREPTAEEIRLAQEGRKEAAEYVEANWERLFGDDDRPPGEEWREAAD